MKIIKGRFVYADLPPGF